MWTSLSRSLGVRAALSVSVILIFSFAVFTYLVVAIQERFFFNLMIREGLTFSEAVLNATQHSMLRDDSKTTAQIVRDLSTERGVSHITIYNHEGTVKFADRPAGVGARVDKEAEACFACHRADEPFSEVRTDERTRIYESPAGHRMLGMITPIYNRPGCYTAACHVHPKSQKVLGVIDVGLSLRDFDAHMGSTIRRIVIVGLLTLLGVILTIGLYITLRVHRPVVKLLDWIKDTERGDRPRRIPVWSKDEIGQLAQAFNSMAARIERRTTELERSRTEYKTLFEQVPCFISVVNREFRIVRQNAAMRASFKGTVGMPCYKVYKQRSSKCEDCIVEQTFTTGRHYMKEQCGITVSGKEANYVSYTAPVRDEKGRTVYAMIISVDIGERLELERELQATKDFQTNLIENSIHSIIAIDEQGRVNIFNRAAENLLGYDADEVIGDTDLGRYFPQPFVDLILEAFRDGSIENPRMVAQETAIRSRDGEDIPVRFSGMVLFADGKPEGAVGFCQDLRAFKQLELEKRDADRLAVVGQTVAGLAHGIKNILQGLEGGLFVVETAIEDKDEALLNRGWDMIRNNIQRVSALVKDLLSYSKARSPEYELTDIPRLAEDVCSLFDQKAREKSITIRREFDPDAPSVYVDQRGIHTSLTNLVSNAIDALEAAHEKTDKTITVRVYSDSVWPVVIEVEDNGVGIDSATQAKIFSGFYSTKGTRGTGLGLLVTSKIVQEHDGEISFESVPGEGSTFRICLPEGERMPDEEANSQSRSLPADSEEERRNGNAA